MIDGELRGEITVDEAGRYGGGPDRLDTERLSVNVTADDTGAEVEFRVSGPGFDRTVTEETVTWSSADARERDLTVELPDEGTGGGGGSSPAPAPSPPDDDGNEESSLVLAAIDVQPESPVVDDEVTLSASGSVAEGGSIAAYEWTIDGEAAGTGSTTLVENQLTVSTMTEVSTGGIGVDCTNADESYYLPADQPGENYFQYDFWIDMEGLD